MGIVLLAGVSLLVLVTFVMQSGGGSSNAAPATLTTANVQKLQHDEVDAAVQSALHRQVQQMMEASKLVSTIYPSVKRLPADQMKRILVTGGAGFVGSHLVDRLMLQGTPRCRPYAIGGLPDLFISFLSDARVTPGHMVYVLDNLFTGRKRNIQHWVGHPNFEFFQRDVTEPFFLEVDQIYHLACPASPPQYQYNPIKTIKTSTMGTLHMLGLAKRVKARMLFTSTSEVQMPVVCVRSGGKRTHHMDVPCVRRCTVTQRSTPRKNRTGAT